MSPAIGIETVSETELFESLDLHENVPCSYNDCEQEATNMLQCPEDGAAETICPEHTIQIAIVRALDPEATIGFDNTCGHTPKMSECQILPLAR